MGSSTSGSSCLRFVSAVLGLSGLALFAAWTLALQHAWANGSSPPANTAAPQVSGTSEVGSALTASSGTWTGSPPPTYTYRWQRCDADVSSSRLGLAGAGAGYLAIDPSDNVFTSNAFDETVTKITPAGVSSLQFGTGVGGVPNDIALDSAGKVYVADPFADKINQIPAAGGAATPFASVGTDPEGIAFDSAGNLYVANGGSNDVTKVDPFGSATLLGSAGSGPFGIAVDPAGNSYTTNFNSNDVTKLLPNGSAPGAPWPVSTGAGSQPTGVGIGPDGNIYTADYGSDAVTKIAPDGTASPLGATGDRPHGIAIDVEGNVFTPNEADDTVTKITPAGGSSIYGSTDDLPSDIAYSARSDNVYTANAGAVPGVTPTASSVTKIGWNCTDISGADQAGYTLTGADEGRRVRVEVTGTNAQGSASAYSAKTAPVEPAPDPPQPSGKPSLAAVGKGGGRSLELKVGCAGSSACTIEITGKLRGGKGKVEPKTVKVKAGKKALVKVRYSPTLVSALRRKRSGKIVIRAKQVGGATRTITVRVALPKPVTG